MNYNNKIDPLLDYKIRFQNWLVNFHGIEKNKAYAWTNWMTSVIVNPEILEKAMASVMSAKTLELSNPTLLRKKYESLLNATKPLPKPECQFCFRKYDNESMSNHAPLCSYGVIVLGKLKQEFFKVMSSRDDKALISEWQAKCDYWYEQALEYKNKRVKEYEKLQREITREN